MKIGIADTMFARVDMYQFVEQAIKDSKKDIEIVRYTVPGFKDLPVACKKLLEEMDCDICVALGMAGGAKIDEMCAHEAATGLIQAQLMTNKHIIVVFVHTNEVKDEKELYQICKRRSYDHTINALKLLDGPIALTKMAGKGIRQGFANEGEIKDE